MESDRRNRTTENKLVKTHHWNGYWKTSKMFPTDDIYQKEIENQVDTEDDWRLHWDIIFPYGGTHLEGLINVAEEDKEEEPFLQE